MSDWNCWKSGMTSSRWRIFSTSRTFGLMMSQKSLNWTPDLSLNWAKLSRQPFKRVSVSLIPLDSMAAFRSDGRILFLFSWFRDLKSGYSRKAVLISWNCSTGAC